MFPNEAPESPEQSSGGIAFWTRWDNSYTIPRMQKGYLILGSTGAGKTTYSRELARRLRAQTFSIDEWMKNLFWMDAPPGGSLEWALQRVNRCEEQIWLTSKRLLDTGTPVVFDLGFSKKSQRDRFKELLASSGHACEYHFLDIPVDLRRSRVRERNKGRAETFAFEVDETTFNWMESYFERPSDDELAGAGKHF